LRWLSSVVLLVEACLGHEYADPNGGAHEVEDDISGMKTPYAQRTQQHACLDGLQAAIRHCVSDVRGQVGRSWPIR
jgi:hypothetical protein